MATTTRASADRVPALPSVARARSALLEFFTAHARELPWRRTRDPYAVWVSEIMLQQTRVETVVPYFTRFLDRFPTARALADAPRDQVLAAWSGLGYYRRARMLHEGARAVVDAHGGALPDTAAELRTLPGIGEYTAGAIASIAFGQREPVVDGNVERVLSRWQALPGDPRVAANRRRIWNIARAFADCDRPGDVNQALMELGATVCTPSAPSCERCPIARDCAARRAGEPERYPERAARTAPREESWNALVALSAGGTQVRLESAREGRWQGMLLPWLVVRAPSSAYRSLAGKLERVGEVTHVLTHARMSVRVYRGEMRDRVARGENVPIDAIASRPGPAITRVVLAAAGVVLPPRHAR